MSNHSFIAPSFAGTWVHCDAAPKLSKAFPEYETDDSVEGTVVHDMIARALITGLVDKVGEITPLGMVVTTEMYESAQCFFTEVLDTATKRNIPSDDFHIEDHIECPGIHAESFGSVDLWFYDKVNNDLFIYDFKHGHGIVEVENNWQLLNYSNGICSRLTQRGFTSPNVWLCIIQPRSFHGDGPIRYWLAKEPVRNAAYGELIHAAERVYAAGTPTATPGAHCRYCNGRRGCPAADNAAMFAADMSTGSTPQELNADQIGTELAILERASKAIEYRITGLREQVTATIKSGYNVKGWAVTNTLGNLAWTAPIEACLALESITGVTLRKPEQLITPTQARNAGVSPILIDQFAGKKSKGLKLVASDDLAKSVFSKE